MSTWMPKDTAAALGPNAMNCDSRSLFLDRFADPAAKDTGNQTPRRDWFNRLIKKLPALKSKGTWDAQLPGLEKFYALLQSRLMVNMAGGVMENAGLCLDRFGLPYIPGSPIKGCARRMALAALREWCEAGGRPEHKPTGKDNPCAGACEPFKLPADMLAAIARIFGWGEQDWRTRAEVLKGAQPRKGENDEDFQKRCEKLWGEKRSDFAWACEPDADAERSEAPTGRNILAQGNALGSHPHSASSPEGASPFGPSQWESIRAEALRLLEIAPDDLLFAPISRLRIKAFAGTVSFLAAYPVDLGGTLQVVENGKKREVKLPELGKLELDVVTVHHKEYYAEPAEPKNVPKSHANWQHWKRQHDEWENKWGTAPDIEEPVPNVFPAVAPDHVFAFALTKLRNCADDDLKQARTWLATGLQTFGLGAKTNAGYGWFDASATVDDVVRSTLRARVEREKKAAEEEAAKQKAEAEVKAKAVEKAERNAALAGLSPEERADKEIELMNPSQFDSKVRSFFKEPKRGGPTEEQKKAIVRALRGPRLAFWQDFKSRATKGDLAKAANDIRQLSKQMFPGNEGKMP